MSAQQLADRALLNLGRGLKESRYRFITPTPLTHERFFQRMGTPLARDLRDVFGWSLPFDGELLPEAFREELQQADVVEKHAALWRSAVRWSSLDDLLFAHLTVAENLMFGMPAHIRGMAARRACALEALAEVGLEGQADKLPGQLSGGQKARVSLLRALLAEPEALLLDEPFSRLDKPLRAAFRTLVFERLKALGMPALLVTHDEEDAPGAILTLTTPCLTKEDTDLV